VWNNVIHNSDEDPKKNPVKRGVGSEDGQGMQVTRYKYRKNLYYEPVFK
jgi:hypothetical protein